MPLYSGIFLKGTGALLTVIASSAGVLYLSNKDRVQRGNLDIGAFADEGGHWKWTLSTDNNQTPSSATATLTYENNSKSWKCIIRGTTKGGANPSTEEIKKQLNKDFKDKTGLPEAEESSATGKAWTKTEKNKYYAQKFFDNCIRNRTEEESKAALGENPTSVTSTINLEMEGEENNKYRFNEKQLKKIYSEIYYSPKTRS